MAHNHEVIIIGGGLAGLVSAIQLSRSGHDVQLFEKKTYPFHRVCGEYISNEVIPFLRKLQCYPEDLHPSQIDTFQLTSVAGLEAQMPLDLGGFGISRYRFDQWLAERAVANGVYIHTNTTVEGVRFVNDQFLVSTSKGEFTGRAVIGAFGKRSLLDASLKRPSFNKRSPYVGVKYHCHSSASRHVIGLHNFSGGYCGFSAVEDDTFNLCYLVERQKLKQEGSIERLEQNTLRKNPHLDRLFSETEFLWDQPVTINEISFSAKEPVFKHMLMVGDSAGMVTPLSGNGMAMAIHGAKLASENIMRFLAGRTERREMEKSYLKQWKAQFNHRLWVGRSTQRLFGNSRFSNFAVRLVGSSQPLARFIMQRTHGQPFQ